LVESLLVQLASEAQEKWDFEQALAQALYSCNFVPKGYSGEETSPFYFLLEKLQQKAYG
jgi:hypothetical protein